ncbi:MAG: hypothetical protein J3Q66DRAFT_407839 [Benniella sp.]|nr:MAG: hypothetical protein J3Q66DRAFT_407839 [Benniella sp.]
MSAHFIARQPPARAGAGPRKAVDHYVALVICHDTEVSLSQVKKVVKRLKVQAIRNKIATTYDHLARESHAGLPSQHELVATAGPAQNGALIVFQRNIRPYAVRSTEALAGSTSLWTLYCRKEIVFEGVSQYQSRKAPDVHSDVPMGDIDMEDVQSKAQASMANPEGKSFQATHWCLIYRSDGALEVRTYRGNIAVYKTYQHFTTNKVDSAGNPIDHSDSLAIRFRKIPLDVVGRETPEDADRDDRGLDGGI